MEMRNIGDVLVLDCRGKITLGEGTMSIRNAIRNALASGTRNVIFNLREVSYIDSSGLGELMRSHTSVVNAGGQLKLLHVPKRIQDLLSMSKLLTVFELFDDEKDAFAAFNQHLVSQ